MSTQPTHWIASTGQVTPVVILEAGCGEHTPKYIPPDPVVVRSIEDYYEFVASEQCLFTDRTKAVIEAKRLREAEQVKIAQELARIERKEVLSGSRLLPSILLNSVNGGSSSSVPVVEVSIESSASPQAEDVVVPKNSPSEEPTQPQTLLQRVIYVVGRDTLSFEDLCTKLERNDWMPKRRSSVSNILSANKHLFSCPDRGTYSLRTPTVLDTEVSEVEEEKTDTQASNPNLEEEESPSEEEEGISEFSTWLSKPMRELTSTHFHYRDEDLVLSEKLNGDGNWVAEIFVAGLELWYEGVCEDRAQARVNAEQSLRSKVQGIGKIIDSIKI